MASTTANGDPEVEPRRSPMDQLEFDGLAALPPLSPNLEEFWTDIKLPSGWTSKTKVIRPKDLSSSKKHPLIVYFYGGGFAFGTPDQLTEPGRTLAEKFGAVVVLPSYRLLPEHVWPTQIKDGWEVLQYLAENAERELGANLDGPDGGFVVGGISAGGSIAAVAAGLSMWGDGTKDFKPLAKPLTGASVAVAWLLTDEIVPEEYKGLFTSREDNAETEGFNTAGLQRVLEAFKPDVHSPWATPFSAMTQGSPSSKIPVYIQACQLDPLRDDNVIFGKALAAKGVSTKIDVFPDDAHTAWTVMPLPLKSTNPTPKEALLAGMEWLLPG